MNYKIDEQALPELFPTHRHDSEFWESLGRTVATFGFLEEMLTKAIFSLTATRTYPEDVIDEEYEKWVVKLERSISDQLGGLIDTYGKAAREHPDFKFGNLAELLNDLRNASKTRNVICHGSWGAPNSLGASKPFFVNRKLEIFVTEIDGGYLDQVRSHTRHLICSVINSITSMGLQFPGSNGPGRVIWE